MGADAAALKPCIAKDVVQHRHELAEMGGAFDGGACKAEILSHFVVVNRQMSVVFLITQHLSRCAEFADQCV